MDRMALPIREDGWYKAFPATVRDVYQDDLAGEYHTVHGMEFSRSPVVP